MYKSTGSLECGYLTQQVKGQEQSTFLAEKKLLCYSDFYNIIIITIIIVLSQEWVNISM